MVSGGLQWYKIVSHKQRHPEIPLATAAVGLVMLALLVFVWRWNRWAVYTLAALAAVNLIAFAVLGGLSWILLITLVLVGALAWFIRAQWPSFH
jgi:MFS superfamily sulfate permease-like transporter